MLKVVIALVSLSTSDDADRFVTQIANPEVGTGQFCFRQGATLDMNFISPAVSQGQEIILSFYALAGL